MDGPASMSLAEQLAARICSVTQSSVSDAAIGWAVVAVLDTVGVTLAGCREPATSLLLDTPGIAEAPGPSLLMGPGRRVGMLDAALINGTASHALDYDDVSDVIGGHPSVPLVAPLLALAEARHAGGGELLVSYLVGVEVQHRLALAVNFHHYEKGWHPTATLGIFGTAAACAHLLQLDPDRTARALALAASMAGGIKANFGTMTKPFHVGRIARDGLLAALLAERGYTSNPGALEHRQGFLEVFNGRGTYDPARALQDLDGPFDFGSSLGLKQFPCCGSTHAAIAMALRLRSEESIVPEQIDRIAIMPHRRRLPHTDNPAPASGLGAKFSIQYATVRALLDGAVRLDHFEGEAYREPGVQALLARVEAHPHPDMPDDAPEQFGAEVILTMRDGRRLARRINHFVGRGPANPMSEDELWEKFSDCARRGLPKERIAPLFERLMTLTAVKDVNDVTRQMEAAAVPRAAPAVTAPAGAYAGNAETTWVP